LIEQFKELALVKPSSPEENTTRPARSTEKTATQEPIENERQLVKPADFCDTHFKYSAETEVRRREPFYDIDFQKPLKQAQKVGKKVRDSPGECEIALEQGPSLHKLRSEASRLSRFKCPDKRTIGVVGNSGQGKSFGMAMNVPMSNLEDDFVVSLAIPTRSINWHHPTTPG
jgi:ABC-type glutathione transport system ATPase component